MEGAVSASTAGRDGGIVVAGAGYAGLHVALRHPSEVPPPGPDLRRPASCVRDVTWSLRNTLRR